MFKTLINKILNKTGFELKRLNTSSGKRLAEGFPSYLAEADKSGVDVNDHINSKLGNPEYDLGIILYPILKELKNPAVCELGVGTGRWSREIIKELKNNSSWQLFLVDHSGWIVNFLNKYFEEEKNVFPVLNDGRTLPFKEDNFLDLIFCQGTFIELNLVRIVSYCSEFHRVLKQNGIAVFNYISLDTDNGWNHLLTQSAKSESCFTYHSSQTIDRIFIEKRFEKINSLLLGNSTYVYFRKK